MKYAVHYVSVKKVPANVRHLNELSLKVQKLQRTDKCSMHS